MSNKLTHLDAQGRARMVDVSDKPVSTREACARGRVRMAPETFDKARGGETAKGDIRAIAEIAGVMGGKRTSDLIPLCHPLPLSSIQVEVTPDESRCSFVVTARAKTTGQTGVEMEALTAVSVACLAIYDMLKAVDRGLVIEDICLVSKSGGVHGDYARGEP